MGDANGPEVRVDEVHLLQKRGIRAPHIHVAQGGALAKFWLEPEALADSSGFPSHKLRKIQMVVTAHQRAFLEAWREHFRTNP